MVQLQPESTVTGTGTCRCDIYAQVGKLNRAAGRNYGGYVPLTLEILKLVATYQSTPKQTGTSQGLQGTKLELIDPFTVNYSLGNEEQRELFWKVCLNYTQWGTSSDMFYPSRRTVHIHADSLLSDSNYCEVLVFVKQLIKKVWVINTGSSITSVGLFGKMESQAVSMFTDHVSPLYSLDVTFYQTANDISSGKTIHAKFTLKGSKSMWTMEADIFVANI